MNVTMVLCESVIVTATTVLGRSEWPDKKRKVFSEWQVVKDWKQKKKDSWAKARDLENLVGVGLLVHMLLREILIDTEYLICSLPMSPVFRLPLPSSNAHLNLIFKNDNLINC